MSFSYDYTSYDDDGTVDQGTLASTYTNALSEYLSGAEGADYVAFLAYVDGGSSDVAAALAIKAAVLAGNFSLSGLFSAAQSKTGEVDGNDITNPTPTLTVTVGDTIYTIDLTDMLGGETTESWETLVKKGTLITHTREFYAESKEPTDYDASWSLDNQPPTATEIVVGTKEYDEHAAGADTTGAAKYETINLLSTASDPDLDPLSVVLDSVKIDNGDGTYSDLPDYMSVSGSTLTIDTNSDAFNTLYKDATLSLNITYQITDGTYTIPNTVDLTITGTADQFTTTTNITVDKSGGGAYSEAGTYVLLGSDQDNFSVNVTGYGDYDRDNEGFTVTGDVTASYIGTTSTGANPETFAEVDPTNEVFTNNWSTDGDLDYTVSFTQQVDGYELSDPDASEVNIELTYNYWM